MTRLPAMDKPAFEAVKAGLQDGRVSITEKFGSGYTASAVLSRLSHVVDRTLRFVWHQSGVPRSLALLAVGGYGRRELFPYSDVDVLVLLPSTPSAPEIAVLEDLIGRFWDLGIEVGHSVRTVPECLEESSRDLTVLTALMDARRVTGNARLFAQLRIEAASIISAEQFYRAKLLEQEQRHAKFQDSPFSLEPNVKESPGGLRDLQVIRWMARAAGFGDSWASLAAKGLITRKEAGQLARDQRLLQDLRVRLHVATGRREDRLLFDYQDQIALSLGFKSSPQRRASEQMMQRYYRTAKSVTQLNTLLIQNFGSVLSHREDEPAEVIDENFRKVHELLDATDPDVFERTPHTILESFLVLQMRPDLKGMTAPTLRALWRARKRIDSNFRRDPGNRARFIEILKQPRGIVHELRRMNQYGILGRYLPSFRRIVGQMQHDLFHVYTVDQHILTVVRNLRRFTMMEFAHEYPLCSRLMAGLERPWLLYVAAIFHDIAKGRRGDHSKLGASEATRFCRDHGLESGDISLVKFLVEHHLTMSRVAQKEDISDPEVVRKFSLVVGSERRLISLYLLTVADIRGTSPKVWNAWKGKLLEDLFHATHRLLRGEMVGSSEEIQSKQSEAVRLLRLYALSDDVKDELWRELDIAYFMRHSAQDIAWHTRLLHARVHADGPVVKARLSPVGEGMQVLIYTQDRRGLFARICDFFGGFAYNIVDARVHTTRHGYALDTFQIMGAGEYPHYRDMISRIEHDLPKVLERREPLREPTTGRVSRQLRHFPIVPEVHIRPDERGQYYLLSVTAGDRPGLLSAIAYILDRYEVSLHTARVITLGERAEDVFVLSGGSMENPRTVLAMETELISALSQ